VPPVADDAYKRARPFLAVDRKNTIDLDGYFALNKTLQPLMSHYENGSLAIIHGAGSEDTTRSHFEAQDIMEHAGRDTGGGWLCERISQGERAFCICPQCCGDWHDTAGVAAGRTGWGGYADAPRFLVW